MPLRCGLNSMAAQFENTPSNTSNRGLALVYAATIFTSAFLLFQIQPMISKAILPWFGGTPAVWTVCLLFFQSLLFAGYAYAHFTNAWLRPGQQAILHIVVLIAALAFIAWLRVCPTPAANPAATPIPPRPSSPSSPSRSASRTSSSPPPARCCKPGSPARSPAALRTAFTHYPTSARSSHCSAIHSCSNASSTSRPSPPLVRRLHRLRLPLRLRRLARTQRLPTTAG